MNDFVRLLLVEDNDSEAQLILNCLESCAEFSLTLDRSATLSDAIAATHDHSYDLLIVDLELPDCAGLANVTRLREAAPSATVIVLSSDEDEQDALEAIRHGAQERLSKQDLQSPQLVRIIRHSLARQQHLLTAQSQAMTDALTGIGNRRAFEREMERRLHENRRHGIPFSLAVFDIDHFKRINDDWGHDVGDKTLRVVGESLYNELRATDMVTRLGGEVFAVIFVSTHLNEALQVSHRVCAKINEMCGARIQDELRLTLSGGVAEVKTGDDLRAILNRADEALYVAKHSGRNCCLAHDGANISAEPAIACAT
ncbi:diguanylate cyclase [Blastopirellula sp. JC732]|uniref:diguanylate cyclase n=1 Tax=Blastopirellula sediminis TaxID=2894196 RepID=A0A9X1MIS0_9BACT|nr:diguanylate cyclase [Blastopirellula sediminis]MCC9604405.1 diguanylate cyclase [Blastopirellula sediminis]MCC9626925.1 diguanylate cyclase [Blastopirellula sediminis]